MFQFLRSAQRIKVVPDMDAFRRYIDRERVIRNTPEGPAAEAEERLDLRMGQTIKALLEQSVGPEEGDRRVHMQNWDWNDDRTRAVYILRSAFKPLVMAELRELLLGEFEDFTIIVLLVDTWSSDEWGGILITRDRLTIQRNVVAAYAIAA